MGCLDRALRLADEELAMAREANMPYSEAFAFYTKAMVSFFRLEHASVENNAKRLIEISREHGYFGYFLATLGSVLLGWARATAPSADSGGSQQALDLVRGGLEGYRRPGARVSQTMCLAMSGEGHLGRGDVQAARAALAEARAAAESSGENSWLPEVYRLQARLLVAEGEATLASEQLRVAVEMARNQDNRLLEIRIALDLLSLSPDRPNNGDARTAVRAALAGFSEGLETPALRQAAAVL
jgi:hypothetical protein